MITQPLSAPPFALLDVTWTCAIVADPDDQRPGAAAHVWRSDCGRMEVRAVGVKFPTDQEREFGVRASREWLAFVDGVPGSLRHGTPRAAMTAATAASKARAA